MPEKPALELSLFPPFVSCSTLWRRGATLFSSAGVIPHRERGTLGICEGGMVWKWDWNIMLANSFCVILCLNSKDYILSISFKQLDHNLTAGTTKSWSL